MAVSDGNVTFDEALDELHALSLESKHLRADLAERDQAIAELRAEMTIAIELLDAAFAVMADRCPDDIGVNWVEHRYNLVAKHAPKTDQSTEAQTEAEPLMDWGRP